jgi:hypothetical protein
MPIVQALFRNSRLGFLMVPKLAERIVLANQLFKRAFANDPSFVQYLDVVELRQQVQAVDG